MKKIGFIGTGIMGSSMIRNLLRAGYQVFIYNRTKEKALPLTEEGAVWCDTPAACAAQSEAVITIVGYPKDVEEVYFGENGVIEGARPGTYLIDMTTSSPDLARRIYENAGEKGLHALDAPVTGGDAGAKAGTLTILAGGVEADFQAVYPIFAAMGKTIVYFGEAGSGQHVKLCNQIAIAGALAGACEAISYARAVGLDEAKMVETIATGAAGSFQLSSVASQGMKGNFAPGFMLKHFIKDMNLGDEAALNAGLQLDVLEHIRSNCHALEAAGLGDNGTQILLRHYKLPEK